MHFLIPLTSPHLKRGTKSWDCRKMVALAAKLPQNSCFGGIPWALKPQKYEIKVFISDNNEYMCVTVCAEEYDNNQGNIIYHQYHELH